MGLSSGTPLWASIVMSLGAVGATHALTLWREGRKRDSDALSAWKKDCESLLTEISDEAYAYFSDPKMIESTASSCQRLLARLGRLGLKIREVQCVEPSNAKESRELMQELKDLITLPDDFQLPSRAIREPSDPLLDQIRSCEARLRTNIAKGRKIKR